ncbi:MAG TPA: septum formation family protein [Candidatus Binatia bacterium]|nr:septum formation family protein [Candidatus Binatia bacterium]
MTDQPSPGSAASDPQDVGTPPTPPPPPPPATPTATGKDRLRLGLILGGIVVFLVVALFAALNNEYADQLAIGQCFNEPSGTEDISTVEKRDCTQEHDAEVFFVGQMTGDTYPIELAFDNFVEANCLPAFEVYIGVPYADAPDHDVGWFYPNENGWEDGKRTVTCYIFRVDHAKMTQSVKAGS